MTPILDLDKYRLPPEMTAPALPRKRPPRHRQGEPFLKGPIPWPWLVQAARLPGRRMAVALLLWREAGCRKSRTVRFRLGQAGELGMAPDTARRALRNLERAGLVTVQRKPGQALEVTLNDFATNRTDEP